VTTGKKYYKSAKRTLGSYISSARKTVTRLFDLSKTCETARSVKNSLLCLSLRTIGVFFVTLGIYAFIISMILTLFSDRAVHPSGIYGGLLCAASSLPLLFSKGNVATALINSRTGSFICHLLSIRKEALPYEPVLNSLSIAFVAGIAVSLATLIFPFSYVICAIAVLIIALTILHSPEAGLTFYVAFLFLASAKLQYLILSVTVVSYILKLIRGKRRFILKKTDLFLPVFAVCTLGGMISSSQAAVDIEKLKYAFLLITYVLCVCLARDCRNIKNLMGFSVILGGTVCSVYLLGFALSAIIPGDVAVAPSFLMDTVLSLPAFESGFAPLFSATLIPVSIAFVMKPHSEGNRLTVFLCFVSMLSALIISENVAYTAAAVIASVILILIAGSRRLYFALALLLGATVITSFSGKLGDKLYGYIFSNIKEAYSEAINALSSGDGALSGRLLFCGQGFGEGTTGSNFFHSLFSHFGLCGSVIFAVLVIAILLEAVALIIRTYKNSAHREYINRFRTIADPAELRMGAVAMICAMISLIICATFSDLYISASSYSWLFLICGVCSAYATGANAAIDKAQSSSLSEDLSERCTFVITKDS